MFELYPVSTAEQLPVDIQRINLQIAHGMVEPLDCVWQDKRQVPGSSPNHFRTVAGLYVAMQQLKEEIINNAKYPTLWGALIWYDLETFPVVNEFWDTKNNYFDRVVSPKYGRLTARYFWRPKQEGRLFIPQHGVYAAAIIELTAKNGLSDAVLANGAKN